ncbi:unnamed protein product [Caenorhabditis sp. 36 PRJEB53466]|nr:unnamed protein product [Caenorhabditis sp. 36 PRJEB53466]
MCSVFLFIALFPASYAQYGLFSGYGSGLGGGYGSGYGGGFGGGYGGGFGGGMPFLPDPFMGPQLYGNPMMGGLGGSAGMLGGCTDLSPQCSVWASTGQCATNPMMMRQTCALSCGTCATGLGGGSTSSFYNNPFGGLGMPSTGLGQYPLSQFIGRSIYETGILRQPTPHLSKDVYRPVSKSAYLPDRR